MKLGGGRAALAKKLLCGAVALGGAAWIALACSDDPHRRTSKEQALGGGGACAAGPGQLPHPACDDSDNICVSKPGCSIDEARCGSKSTCLPIGNNRGKDVLDFRLRRLKIATPEALASTFIQKNIVTRGIDLAERFCGEQGTGLFTWLLRVDRTNNTLITGGAPPPRDPLGGGFCFARFDVGSIKVAPIAAKIAFEGDTFNSVDPIKVKIPIFLNENIDGVIILPLSEVKLSGVTVSEGGDCIGSMNDVALDSNCIDDSLCSKWKTAGALGGFITLEEADEVRIADLNDKSLCALFSSESAQCARDPQGKVLFKGDYCSTDKQPGSCGDSMWLAATFAASAVKIFDGQGTVATCSGVAAAEDAGRDAGSDASDAADGD